MVTFEKQIATLKKKKNYSFSLLKTCNIVGILHCGSKHVMSLMANETHVDTVCLVPPKVFLHALDTRCRE